MAKDIRLDDNNDLDIVNGDFYLDDSTMQEVSIILNLNQGELKWNPLLGPNLVQELKRKLSRLEIDQKMKTHLALDEKDYNQLKPEILKLLNR